MFSADAFVRLDKFRHQAITFSAIYMYLELPRILKCYCAHDHPELPHCKQTVC